MSGTDRAGKRSRSYPGPPRVILGCGGFEHNEQMRVKYQRGPIATEWTVGAKANTGDGILAAEKLGAAWS